MLRRSRFDDSGFQGHITCDDGECHLRRSHLRYEPPSPFGDGIGVYRDAMLFMENSSIGPAPYPRMFLWGHVDIRYSTIALAESVTCESNNGAAATGTIRNSIVLGGTPAIEANCDGITWFRNAVNETGFGTQVPSYNSSWFSFGLGSAFRLTAAGEGVFADIAQWEPGDPLLDSQGDPRPTNGPGFPGVDEP